MFASRASNPQLEKPGSPVVKTTTTTCYFFSRIQKEQVVSLYFTMCFLII